MNALADVGEWAANVVLRGPSIGGECSERRRERVPSGCGGSALEHPKLANAEGRVEGGWASRRGPHVFRQELCASTVRKPTNGGVCRRGSRRDLPMWRGPATGTS